MASFVTDLDLQAPLEPREAFYGGCTNAICLYHTTVVDKEIHYDGYTSLYPWVNKYGKYPVGHPTDLSPYFGLAKCTVLPPTDLYHPVLPYRHESKLTFPLCRTCVHDNLPTTCQHTDNERALTGMWCTPELEETVRRGYTIINVNEIWHFPASQTGLFVDYVNTWLKLKEEASGWPGECTTKEQRTAHIAPYQTRGDCVESCQHGDEQRTAVLGQTHAEFHVGQIWPTDRQDPSPRIHRPTIPSRVHGQ